MTQVYFCLAGVIFACFAFLGSQSSTFPDCLNSSPTQTAFHAEQHPECRSDTLHFADDSAIRSSEQFLGLKGQEIAFIGCAGAPFATVPPHGITSSSFTIYYPLTPSLMHDAYTAPLLHEMGHVFQLKQAGSYHALLDSLSQSTARVELGADFIAGIEAHRLSLEPASFLVNLSLISNYKRTEPSYYGRPEDRAAAFRFGYFGSNDHDPIAISYADFQDNLFAQIIHM